MQNAEGGGVSARSENPNDGSRSIVPELVSSIAHIQASRSIIAMEPALSNQDVAADIGMLDARHGPLLECEGCVEHLQPAS